MKFEPHATAEEDAGAASARRVDLSSADERLHEPSQHEALRRIYASRGRRADSESAFASAGDTVAGQIDVRTGEDRSVLDVYASATRDVPLLSKEQEAALGREMRESRTALAAALAGVPASIERFNAALESATKGERPLTDAVLTPFGNIMSDDGARTGGPPGKGSTREVPPWRPLAQSLSQQLARWRRAARANGYGCADAAAIARDMAVTLCDIEPAAIVLAEIADELDGVRRRIASLRMQARMRAELASRAGATAVASRQNKAMREGGGAKSARVRLNAAEQRAVKALEVSVGVASATLDSCVTRALSHRARYDAARQHMVEANLRLAFHMARKLVGNGVAFEDLVQEAILGLMRAAEKFDPALGFKFSTYASQWIWQGITRAVADGCRTIRVAAHMHDTIIRLNKLSRTMQQELGRDPTLPELAHKSGLAQAKVRKALDSARHPLSLDAPIADHEDVSLGAIIEEGERCDPMEQALDDEVSSEVTQLLQVLPPREALILRLRHGIGVAEPYTLEDIGKVLGITRERTRQLEARAMERLRDEVDPQLALALRP